MLGRQYAAGSSYRYGFNGQEKSTEIDPNGNNKTAEFWQYDSRIGRRWNLDPRPDAAISPYNCFAGNPIWFSDPLGDTSKIYGTAEVTNTTLLDKGGVNERAGAGQLFKDAKINPVYAKDNKTLVGYNVYDVTSQRQDPIYQLETEADLASFKKNYKWEFGGAQLYYANGEPSAGMKQMVAAYDGGAFNSGLYAKGLKQEWKDAFSDPVFVTQMILSLAHAGTAIADRSSVVLPNREQNSLIKFSYNGMSNVSGGRSGGKAPLLGKPNSYTITQGGHLIFYEANGRALWDVSKDRVKIWEWHNGFPKDGGYIIRNVPDELKNIIDASK